MPPPDDAFAAFRVARSAAAVVTDFDGTLSEIVEDPASARPLAGVVDTLHALAAEFGCVAVVSGRPVSFLRSRLEIDERPSTALVLSGLYGLEWFAEGTERTEPAALPFRSVIEEVAARADAEAPAGVGVERKGLSVTLHVRTAEDLTGWALRWSEEAAGAAGLVVHAGRKSFELRPPLAFDKGTVVSSLVAGRRAACFLGDDLGDLPAFDALDALQRDAGAATVRVGVRSREAPPSLLERADVIVDGPGGSLALLRSLLA